MDAEKTAIEPFDNFAAFMRRFAEAEGIDNIHYITPRHLAEIHRVARELGVVFHDDGSLELIRQ